MMTGQLSQKNGSNMGYYTSYGIAIEADPGFEEQEEKFQKELFERSGEDSDIKELFTYGVYAKLYDLESWIDELAPKYPHLLIMLSGDGEESDDLWESRWKGNVFERMNAAIPPFTKAELLSETERKNKN